MKASRIAGIGMIGLLSLALTLTPAVAAAAHDGLIGSSPTPGAEVRAELTRVGLTFSEDFLTIGDSTAPFAVQLKGPDGAFYNVGCVELRGPTISTDVALGESGTYEVLWQVVSSDGHSTSDTYTFTYVRPADVTASTGSSTGVSCDPVTGEAITPTPTPIAGDPTATAAPNPESDDTFGRVFPWVLAGLGVMALGAAGVVLQVQIARRRSSI